MHESIVSKPSLLKHIALQATLIFTAFFCASTLSFADNNSTGPKISPEEAFLQGQKYLEQTNVPLAELSLTRIPSSSPYAKLLSGNIAAKNGDIDRSFLLLLPLQSNTSLTAPAAASLHASLSNAYEKQGDSYNALDQLIRREEFLTDTQAIESNHEKIWKLLTGLNAQDLIGMRGESTDTATQGWIDLGLIAKNSDSAAELSTWFNSYPDHPAIGFAKTLTFVNSTNKPNAEQAKASLPLNGNVALILPFDDTAFAEKANAFKLGLQAALTKNAIPNTIKTYASLGDQESFGDLYAYARDEGASYFIGPLKPNELIEPRPEVHAIALLDSSLPGDTSFQHAGLSLQDEAQTLVAFANNHAFQRITILAADTDTAKEMADSFQALWQGNLKDEANVITLPKDLKDGDVNLLDLKAAIAGQNTDMLLLAMSTDEARIIRPYLDISIPTLAFSSINNSEVTSNSIFNAVRFVDIPFLLDNDSQFGYYHEQAANLKTKELQRWFALGVDTLQLLLAGSRAPEAEVIIDGLTGRLMIDKTGQIKRTLPMARFTYSGTVLEDR